MDIGRCVHHAQIPLLLTKFRTAETVGGLTSDEQKTVPEGGSNAMGINAWKGWSIKCSLGNLGT